MSINTIKDISSNEIIDPNTQVSQTKDETVNSVNSIHMNPIPKWIYAYNQFNTDNSDIEWTRTRYLWSANYEYPKK